MLRVCLIGPGDINYHFSSLLKMKEKDIESEISKVAKALADSGCEILLLPDRGICFEVAKKFKEFGGSKVIGAVPLSDKDFGIEHLRPYMTARVKGKKLFDKFINTENWYKQDLIHCTLGDVVLMLGNSLGSLGELVYGFYLYKLFLGEKPKVSVKREAIHPEIRAGKNVPYLAIIYSPFFKEKLNYEIEAYIKKLGGKIIYVNDGKELKEVLEKIAIPR